MAENASEEETILRIFSQFLQQCDLLISYNGDRFDQPYLEARYEKYGIPSPFTGKQSLDLYLLKKRDAFTADEILGHNLEDVLGLGRIFDMLGYLCIYDGDYEVTYSEFDGDNLILKLKLPCTLPQEFSNGNTDFYLTGKDEEINLIIKTTDGKLKQYYADYKDYYYLPEEDTVIPKSLGSGIDRKHRKAATRNTCYTWFTCSDAFLSSPVQQKQYLTYTLSCLIETLERV